MKKIVVIFLVLLTITSCSSKNSEESKAQSSDQGKGITMAVNESEFAKTFFQFQGNEQYSGYYDTESLDIANPQIRWQIKLENDYGGNVGSIIHGKIIYMASWGKIYGIDRVKGKNYGSMIQNIQ